MTSISYILRSMKIQVGNQFFISSGIEYMGVCTPIFENLIFFQENTLEYYSIPYVL